MKVIKLSDVIIPNKFKDRQPSNKKLDKVRLYVDYHGELDKPLVLDGMVLTDNYIRYLVALEYGFTNLPYITIQEYRESVKNEVSPTTYIIGKFKNNNKEYVWKVPDGMNVNIGDRVLVRSKCKDGRNGVKAVTVFDVFNADSSKMKKHKHVVKVIKTTLS